MIGEEFHENNEAPASRNLEFPRACATQMAKGKRIAHVRADSEACQAELFTWCEEHEVTFAIGGVQDAAVQALQGNLQKSAPSGSEFQFPNSYLKYSISVLNLS